MNHRDCEMSDMTVVIRAAFADDPGRFGQTVELLNKLGLGISNINKDLGVVEGTCESIKVRDIEKLEFVETVRITFNYIADYPPGDPRDLDGQDDEEAR